MMRGGESKVLSYRSLSFHLGPQLPSHFFFIEFGTSFYIDSSMLAEKEMKRIKYLNSLT